jgi:Peptidase A4 family
MRRTRRLHANGTLFLAVLVVSAGVLVGQAQATTVKSRAWAGYQANHDSFRSVAATWTVPTIKCSGTTPAGDPDSYFSVGLGPTVSDSERVGVRELCTGTLPTYVSYLQMNGLYEIRSIDPAPGDKISARVSYRHGRYRFSLSDSTQGLSFSFRYRCGRFSSGQGTCSHTTAQVSAGIWAPHRSPLAKYGKVVFGNVAITDAHGHHGSLAKNAHWKVTRFTEYHGAKLAASASSLRHGGTRFRDTWHHR